MTKTAHKLQFRPLHSRTNARTKFFVMIYMGRMGLFQGGDVVRLFHKEMEAFLVAEGVFGDGLQEMGMLSMWLSVCWLYTEPAGDQEAWHQYFNIVEYQYNFITAVLKILGGSIRADLKPNMKCCIIQT